VHRAPAAASSPRLQHDVPQFDKNLEIGRILAQMRADGFDRFVEHAAGEAVGIFAYTQKSDGFIGKIVVIDGTAWNRYDVSGASNGRDYTITTQHSASSVHNQRRHNAGEYAKFSRKTASLIGAGNVQEGWFPAPFVSILRERILPYMERLVQ
jgi:hypothetical protein